MVETSPGLRPATVPAWRGDRERPPGPAPRAAVVAVPRHCEEACTARPSVEFHRSTCALVYIAAGLGLVLAVGVLWYVMARGGR